MKGTETEALSLTVSVELLTCLLDKRSTIRRANHSDRFLFRWIPSVTNNKYLTTYECKTDVKPFKLMRKSKKRVNKIL